LKAKKLTQGEEKKVISCYESSDVGASPFGIPKSKILLFLGGILF
jgi:hypothetical protein